MVMFDLWSCHGGSVANDCTDACFETQLKLRSDQTLETQVHNGRTTIVILTRGEWSVREEYFHHMSI